MSGPHSASTSASTRFRQALVVTADEGRRDAAEAFLDLVASDQGREVMRSYGFVLPGEPVPGAGG